MHAGPTNGYLVFFGLLSIAYGLGMALVSWRSPTQSLYYQIFKPRWNFGVEASRRAAFVQAPLFASLGGILVFGAFESEYTKIFTVIFFAAIVFSVGSFFLDWASPDEP